MGGAYSLHKDDHLRNAGESQRTVEIMPAEKWQQTKYGHPLIEKDPSQKENLKRKQ